MNMKMNLFRLFLLAAAAATMLLSPFPGEAQAAKPRLVELMSPG